MIILAQRISVIHFAAQILGNGKRFFFLSSFLFLALNSIRVALLLFHFMSFQEKSVFNFCFVFASLFLSFIFCPHPLQGGKGEPDFDGMCLFYI